MAKHLKVPAICDQALQYLLKSVGLLGVESLKYLLEVGQLFLANVEFERLEIFIQILAYTANSLQTNAAPMIRELFPKIFDRVI